ncbi:hypothetical protein GCM10010182_60770 [Actinomadura cremea]|nr:hypothetical protein GCM10010182_60770 [Actinomadura cremea]
MRSAASETAADAEVHDLGSDYVLPGFVDLHMHGGDGAQVPTEDPQEILAAVGADRIALVTDATRAAGVNDGRFNLGPLPVLARDGKVTMLDGVTDAGSTLTMDRALRHAVQCVGIPITQAVAAATTPARMLGLGERTGRIESGKDADLVVLTDDLRVRTVIAAGAVVHGTRATGADVASGGAA